MRVCPGKKGSRAFQAEKAQASGGVWPPELLESRLSGGCVRCRVGSRQGGGLECQARGTGFVLRPAGSRCRVSAGGWIPVWREHRVPEVPSLCLLLRILSTDLCGSLVSMGRIATYKNEYRELDAILNLQKSSKHSTKNFLFLKFLNHLGTISHLISSRPESFSVHSLTQLHQVHRTWTSNPPGHKFPSESAA